MERRQDHLTELIIDAALNVCATHGVQAATIAMAEHDIRLGTILRVLTGPPRKRRCPGQRPSDRFRAMEVT